MEQIPEAVWASPVTSRLNADNHTLAEELGEQPTLLIFLRHLG